MQQKINATTPKRNLSKQTKGIVYPALFALFASCFLIVYYQMMETTYRSLAHLTKGVKKGTDGLQPTPQPTAPPTSLEERTAQTHKTRPNKAQMKRANTASIPVIQRRQLRWRGALVEAVANEWLAWPTPGSTAEEMRAALAPMGGRLRVSPTGAWQLTFATQQMAQSALPKLQQHPLLQRVRPHFLCTGVAHQRRRRSYPQGLPQSVFWFHKQAGFHYQSSENHGGKGVIVALLDTGIAHDERGQDDDTSLPTAPTLQKTHVLPGKDLIENDNRPTDDNQHGTFLATLIAGTYGIAPGASLLPVKVLDKHRIGTELSVIEGIKYAVAQGAHVINLSLTFPQGYFPGPAMTNAIEAATQRGIVIVAAAGNGGGEPGDNVRYPAAFPQVIAVGATRLHRHNNAVIARYSSRGGALDLVAPGGDLSKDLNKDGVPDGIISQTILPNDPQQFGEWLMSGTSISAAFVTSAVALLLAKGAKARQVEAILARSAKRIRGAKHFRKSAAEGHLQIHRALRLLKRKRTSDKRPTCYVNAMPRMTRPSAGKSRAWVDVEVLNAKQRSLGKHRVMIRWLGAVQGHRTRSTNRHGKIRFASPTLNGTGHAFGFVVDAVINRARQRCHLHPVLRTTPSFQKQFQDQRADAWFVRYDLRTMSGFMPNQVQQSIPTNLLVATGTGLISSVKVFGDDAFRQNVYHQLQQFSFTPIYWSLGYGTISNPLGFGSNGGSTLWKVDATSHQSTSWTAMSQQTLGFVSGAVDVSGKKLKRRIRRNKARWALRWRKR